MTVTVATGASSIGGYTISASRRSEPPSDRRAPTLWPSDGSGQPEPSVWTLCSSSASAIYDACWVSMSAVSTVGGHTGRLVNARPVRRRSLPNAISGQHHCDAGARWAASHPQSRCMISRMGILHPTTVPIDRGEGRRAVTFFYAGSPGPNSRRDGTGVPNSAWGRLQNAVETNRRDGATRRNKSTRE
jgi:hypothetical protein